MDLLKALKSSDSKTQDEAFAALKEWVYPIAYRRLAYSFPIEVDEAVMEAMSEIFGQVDEIESEDDLRMIAKRVAMNHAVSRWRELMAKKRGAKMVQSSDQLKEEYGDRPAANDAPQSRLEDSGDAPFPSTTSDHLSTLDIKDIRKILETLQVELKLEHRLALKDVLDGLSYEEISLKRGWAFGSVGVYVKRGLDAMREQRKKYPQLTKEAIHYIVKLL